MADLEHANLPVIDFSKIISSNSSRDGEATAVSQEEKRKLYSAFKTTGFVYLKNHGIPDVLERALFSHAERFFALPEDEKAKIETGEAKFFHGWFNPQRTSKNAGSSDKKEAFDMGNEDDKSRPNQWPENWPDFRQDMTSFFEMCHNVHLDLLDVLGQAVGLEEGYFGPYVQKKDHFFRVLHYPETSLTSSEELVRAGLHTDYGTLTLLFNDGSGGLQVRNNDGQFVNAPPLPGCCIVNVGDMLARWFNDTLKSTEHRVIEPPGTGDFVPARYAIAFFGQPNKEALIEPVPGCCTADHPKKYGPVYAGQHVRDRLAKLHKEGRNTDEWRAKDQSQAAEGTPVKEQIAIAVQ